MITEEMIMDLLREYANTKKGKEKIKKTYGIDYEDGGTLDGATKKEMVEEAKKMKEILLKHIHGKDVLPYFKPEAIIIDENPKKNKDGQWEIKLYFDEKMLHRDSLNLEEYSEGLNDIILLFSKGYHARNRVYGYTKDTIRGTKEWVKAYSRTDREPNPFLKNAVAEFNASGKMVKEASLIGDYKDL